MKKINVMHLGSPTGLFGAERWILALVKYMDTQQFHVIVSSIKDDPKLEVPLCTEANKLGLETQIFKAYGKVNFSAIKLIRRYIKEKEIHILHTHTYKQDIIGLLATLNTPCKLISTPHGWSKKADLKLMIYESLDRAVFPFFDAVVPLSEDLYNSLKKIPFLSPKLHLIKNGVDIEEIKSIKRIASEIIEAKKQEAFIIGYIGQLIPRKGIDILLFALKDIEIPEWRLFIVGDGPQKGELERLSLKLGLSNRVHFTGFREDRLTYLKGFDVFVLPSRLEGIPRCLMEAGAMGKPIIASDIPGCRDVVLDGKTGLLFHSEDARSLGQRLEQLYTDKKLQAELGKNASFFIKKHYSANRMAKEYEELYFYILKS